MPPHIYGWVQLHCICFVLQWPFHPNNLQNAHAQTQPCQPVLCTQARLQNKCYAWQSVNIAERSPKDLYADPCSCAYVPRLHLVIMYLISWQGAWPKTAYCYCKTHVNAEKMFAKHLTVHARCSTHCVDTCVFAHRGAGVRLCRAHIQS